MGLKSLNRLSRPTPINCSNSFSVKAGTSVQRTILLRNSFPGIYRLGQLFHLIATQVLPCDKSLQTLYISKIICFISCRFAIINHIIGYDGTTEKHGLDQRRIGTSGTMTMNIHLGIGPQSIQYIKIIDAVKQNDIRIFAIRITQIPGIFAMLPVADEYQLFTTLCKSLQSDMTVILRLYPTNSNRIFSTLQAIPGEALVLKLLTDLASHMVASVSNKNRFTVIGFGHIILYSFIIRDNHIGPTNCRSRRETKNPSGHSSPLGTTELQSVDIDNQTLTAKQPEDWQKTTTRGAQYQYTVIAPHRLAQRPNIVRDTLHTIGMQGYVFQDATLIERPRLPRNILTAAKNRILNIRWTVIANDILYQRFKTAITRGNTLRAHDCYFFHKIRVKKESLLTLTR